MRRPRQVGMPGAAAASRPLEKMSEERKRGPSDEPVKQNDRAFGATPCALYTELSEHAVSEEYLAATAPKGGANEIYPRPSHDGRSVIWTISSLLPPCGACNCQHSKPIQHMRIATWQSK